MAGKVGPALAMGNTVVVKPAPQDPLAVIDVRRDLRRGRLPARRRQRRRPAAAPTSARRSSRRRTSTWSASPARPTVGQRIGEVCGPRHEAPAARARRQGRGHRVRRRRPRRPPSAPSPRCGPSTPARSAPRRPGCIAQRGVYDHLVAGLAAGGRPHEGRRPARAPTPSSARSSPRCSATASRATSQAGVDEGARAASPAATAPTCDKGFYVEPDPARRLQARHAGRAGGDLRPGRRRRAVRRRGRGASPSPTAPSSASTTTCSPATRPGRMRVARQLRTGNVGINTAQRNHEAPFGGFKQSAASAATAAASASTPTASCSRIVWPG